MKKFFKYFRKGFEDTKLYGEETGSTFMIMFAIAGFFAGFSDSFLKGLFGAGLCLALTLPVWAYGVYERGIVIERHQERMNNDN